MSVANPLLISDDVDIYYKFRRLQVKEINLLPRNRAPADSTNQTIKRNAYQVDAESVFSYSAHVSFDSSETPVLTYIAQEGQPDTAALAYASDLE